MATNHVGAEKGRTLTTVGIIIAGLLLYNLLVGTPEKREGTVQQHSDFARDKGIATVFAVISPTLSAEIDIPATIVSRVGATTYQLAGSLYATNNSSEKTPYSWYVQIEAIPNCFDYNRHSCWVTISGPTIVQD